MRRRIGALLVMMVILSSCFLFPVFAETEETIRFNESQELKILIIADPQDVDNPQQAMLTLINESLDKAEPDLVIYLGDMIHGKTLRGEDKVRKAIDAVVTPVVQRQIPFALVFGNHDEECGISNEEQLLMYQSYPGCLAVEGEEMPGCGNYYILVENPVHLENPIVLWFLDSGNHAEPGKGTYGYVKEEQNEWMLKAYAKLKAEHGEPVSYIFQHIPVPQVYNMLKTVSFGTPGAVTCYGPNLFKWYLPDEQYIWEGNLGEGPCSSEYDSGEFDAWKQMNVKAAFFGHDHLNDYCGTYEGIDMIATAGASFYLYGRGGEHGTRTITFDANNPSSYKTKMLYYKDIVSEPLPGLFVSTLGVLIQQYLFMGLAVLIVLIVFIVWLIRHIRKGRKKKNAAL